MIEIKDTDLPITVAQKIITGTKPYNPTPVMAAMHKVVTGEDVGETGAEQDMFDLEDIKEIADYLMIYYNSHPQGD